MFIRNKLVYLYHTTTNIYKMTDKKQTYTIETLKIGILNDNLIKALSETEVCIYGNERSLLIDSEYFIRASIKDDHFTCFGYGDSEIIEIDFTDEQEEMIYQHMMNDNKEKSDGFTFEDKQHAISLIHN